MGCGASTANSDASSVVANVDPVPTPAPNPEPPPVKKQPSKQRTFISSSVRGTYDDEKTKPEDDTSFRVHDVLTRKRGIVIDDFAKSRSASRKPGLNRALTTKVVSSSSESSVPSWRRSFRASDQDGLDDKEQWGDEASIWFDKMLKQLSRFDHNGAFSRISESHRKTLMAGLNRRDLAADEVHSCLFLRAVVE